VANDWFERLILNVKKSCSGIKLLQAKQISLSKHAL